MKITLVTFAAVKEVIPAGTELMIKEHAAIQDLRQALLQRTPAIAELLRASRFAVNEILVNDETRLHENEIVYIIPPSSGG
jgi:molybdopterin converting factor small subunit